MATIAPAVASRRNAEAQNTTAPETTDPPSSPVHQRAQDSAATSWSPAQAAAFLESIAYLPKSMAVNTVKLQVDGATLLKLTTEGWRELAAPEEVSCIAVAKVRTEIERLAVAKPVPHLAKSLFKDESDSKNLARFKNEKEFVAFCDKKVFEGGAEHTRQWVPSIANASIDGGALKGHVLRFLSMYNVVDLLSVTIVVTYLYDGKESLPETYWDIVQAFIYFLSGLLSGTGMISSTILYNTASSVGEANFHAFVKTYGVNKVLMFVNDASIWGFNFLCMAMTCTFLKLSLHENSFDSTFEIVRGVVVTLPALYFPFLMANRAGPGVQTSTNYALFGGLMSDLEVIPPGETSGWATRWSQEDITNFLMGVCHTNMDFPHAKPWTPLQAMELNIMKKYSDSTNDARKAQEESEGDRITSLASVLGIVAGGGAKKRRKSTGKVQLMPGDAGL
mmetsp:Transcript_16701/g.31263  ORF Transcript_16701/g.31263 Transcript_16701/m.31263 type:complete len:449 (+) Transcript_16701:155-1501(+)